MSVLAYNDRTKRANLPLPEVPTNFSGLIPMPRRTVDYPNQTTKREMEGATSRLLERATRVFPLGHMVILKHPFVSILT